MKKYPAVLFLFTLALYLSSCSSSKKLSTPAVSIHVPDTLPALPVSEINVALKIAGRPLLAMADSIVPKEFTSEGWPACLDLAALLKTNLPALDAQLNRPPGSNLYSNGHIRELKLIGLLAGEKTLQAQLFINASLAITSTRLSL